MIFVPNVEFDFIAYDAERNAPLSFSLKTSLRERYKQADLEALALKYVHRQARSFLLTIDPELKHVNHLTTKIKQGHMLGLEAIHHVAEPSFSDFLLSLKDIQFSRPEKVSLVEATHCIV